MLIVGVLASISLYAVRSARSSGNSALATSTANAYADAIDRFARDHDGRYPAAIGSTDWPDAVRGPFARVLGEHRLYLRSIPESVQTGQVTIGGGAGDYRIDYRPQPGGYLLEVTRRDQDPCVIVGGAASADGRTECSRR